MTRRISTPLKYILCTNPDPALDAGMLEGLSRPELTGWQ